MKISNKQDKILLSKMVESQGFIGDSGVAGVDEVSSDEPVHTDMAGEEVHDPFMHELEHLFKKHGRHLTPEMRQHLNPGDSPVSDDGRDFAGGSDSGEVGSVADGASSVESYQDNTDPGKPYGPNLGVGNNIGGVGDYAFAGAKPVKVVSRKGLSRVGNTKDFIGRLLDTLNGK